MSQFFAILTAIGEAKHANAAVLGTKVNYAAMAVGDGNGVVPVPDRLQKTLVHEVRRAPINTSFIDPDNGSQIIVEQVIPETEGGWWIREAGIFDDAGDMIAVANVPPTYKPQLAEGSGRNQVVRIVLLLANASVVNLKIDPAVVLATREYADGLFNTPSGVDTGDYGDATHYPTFTVDKKGRVTKAGVIKTVSVWDDIPEEYIGDIIFVKGLGEMWWVDNQFLTGYRTKVCGLPAQTLDRVARSFTMELRGGFFDKSIKKYWGLWSFINENSLLVPEANYKDGEGFFCDTGNNMIKVPNQDDMFWRNIGTDKDTANPRNLGSYQADSVGPFTMQLSGYLTSIPSAGSGNFSLNGGVSSSWTTSYITRYQPSVETRGPNSAMASAIFL